MIFEYLAVGSDGNQQKGKIEAQNQNEATEKLNSMSLSVINLNLLQEKNLSRNPEHQSLKTFIFLGKDQENQEVEGSIEAENELIAYKRLVEEFGVSVQWIVDDFLSAAAQAVKKKMSVQNIEDLAYERGIKIEHKKNFSGTDVIDSDLFNDNFFIEQEKLQQRVMQIVNLVVPIIKNFIQEKKPSVAINFEEQLSALQKVKMSNNLQFIQDSIDEIVAKLLEYFADDVKDAQLKKDLLTLQSLTKNAFEAKMKKEAGRFFDQAYQVLQRFTANFQKEKQEKKRLNPEFEKLRNLELEKSEIQKLLLLHAWGILVKTGSLRAKHKVALIKLWNEYKKVSKSIQVLEMALKQAREFEKEDFTGFVYEIEYFSAWLFLLYFVFFIFSEISLLKSQIFSSDFIWSILQTPMLPSITFLLFLVLLISPYLQRESKNPGILLLAYSLMFFVSTIFYLNY